MKPCHTIHPTFVPTCRVCQLAAGNPKYRKMWDVPTPLRTSGPRIVVPLPVCEHLGDPLTGVERESAKLTHAREWRHCEHPGTPLGPAVCRCKGCGPRCPGYKPAGDGPT
jgi:hypothetical protein